MAARLDVSMHSLYKWVKGHSVKISRRKMFVDQYFMVLI
ncbi:hypothetical protein AB1699_13640 [Pseudomonas synxantha]